MAVKPEQTQMIKVLGFDINNERFIGPVKLILETPDFLLVLPPDQSGHSGKLKAIRIRRDLVDSILFPKKNLKGAILAGCPR